MRSIKAIILTAILSVFVATVNAQERSFKWDKLMNAIISVESKGDTNAKKGNSAGILQLTPIAVAQCNKILKEKKSKKRYTLADRFNANKSKEMFVLIQEYYNPQHNIERAIRLWNGGPNYSVSRTQKYYQRVMKYYRR